MTSQYVPKLTADERKRVEENFEIPLEQFEDELKKEWDRGIGIGIKTGHLSRRIVEISPRTFRRAGVEIIQPMVRLLATAILSTGLMPLKQEGERHDRTGETQ